MPIEAKWPFGKFNGVPIAGLMGRPGADGQDGAPGAPGADGEDGADGVTFTPAVSSAGVISWTNDGGRQNPTPVNIKGPQGANGDPGEGVPTGGVTGQVLKKKSNADYDTEWGTGGDPNAVSYDAQTGKTDAQKAQARENIGATAVTIKEWGE